MENSLDKNGLGQYRVEFSSVSPSSPRPGQHCTQQIGTAHPLGSVDTEESLGFESQFEKKKEMKKVHVE